MPERLALSDPTLFPVQAFFNALNDSSLLEVLGYLKRRIGFVTNEVACIFPEDLDPGDTLFEGVRFSIFEESVTISENELMTYIKEILNDYISCHPGESEAVESLLSRQISSERRDSDS